MAKEEVRDIRSRKRAQPDMLGTIPKAGKGVQAASGSKYQSLTNNRQEKGISVLQVQGIGFSQKFKEIGKSFLLGAPSEGHIALLVP